MGESLSVSNGKFAATVLTLAVLLVALVAGSNFGDVDSFYKMNLSIVLSLLCLVALFKIELALALFVCSPLSPDLVRHMFQIPGFTDTSVTFALVCASFFLGDLVGQHKLRFGRFQFLPEFAVMALVFLYEAYMAATGLMTVSFTRGLITYFANPLIVMCIAFAMALCVVLGKERLVFKGIVAIVTAAILSAWWDRFYHGYDPDRIAGYLGSSNSVGEALIVGFPLLVLIRKRCPGSLIFRYFPYLVAVALLISKCRAAILALSFVGVTWVMIFSGFSPRLRRAFILVALPVLVWAVWATVDDIAMAVSGISMTELNMESSGRIRVWQETFDFVFANTDRLLWGAGPFYFKNIVSLGMIDPHNHFLRLWVSVGGIPTLCIILAYLSIFRKVCILYLRSNEEVRNVAEAVILCFVGTFVAANFSHFRTGAWQTGLLWCTLGYLSGQIALGSKESTRVQKPQPSKMSRPRLNSLPEGSDL